MGRNKTINIQRITLPNVDEINKEAPHHNYYAVMEFRSEQELNISYDTNSYVNTINHFYRNGVKAMEKFLHTNNRNTIIATGENITELRQDMIKQTKLFNVIKK